MKAPPPRMTVTLGAITGISYLLLAAMGKVAVANAVAGFIPARLEGLVVIGALPVWITPLTSALLHANALHLGFNLLMLAYCGREDEVALGSAGIVALYVVGAYAAAAAQFLVGPHSAVPVVGASGAISALVGAYALLYGQRRPSKLSPRIARWVHIAWLAAAWVAVQMLLGVASAVSGIAVAAAAHIGGFIAGLLLARPLLRWRYRKA